MMEDKKRYEIQFFAPYYMRDLNMRVQGLKHKSFSIRDYIAQFHLLTSHAGMVENEQAHLEHHMNGLHKNIQQILYLH